MVYSENMDEYVDYLAEIVRLGNPSFEKYFLDNWNNCTDMWVSFQRAAVFTLVTPQTTDWNVVTVSSKI